MDKKQKVVKFFSSEIKSVDMEKMTVDAVVSTKKTDRDGDVILPEAFTKRLKTYKEHPVFLSSHYYYDLKSQIGEAVSVKITDNGLEVKFKYYAGEGNDQADWAFNLAQKGIAAFSIGFMGWEYDWIKEKDESGGERVTGRKYTDVELLEISQVLVPSNRGALQSGRSAVGVQTELLELAAKAFGDGTLKEVVTEPKAEAVTTEAAEKKDFCKCESVIRYIKVDSICGVCDLPLTKEAAEKIQKFCDEVSGKNHYSEALLPTGSTGSILSAKEASEAVNQAFKKINP